MNVLVLNAGSSSLKYRLVDTDSGAALAAGLVERIGEGSAEVTHSAGTASVHRSQPVADHAAALRLALELFDEIGPPLAEAHIGAVGHRAVHGGSRISRPTVLDDGIVDEIEALSPLAPLHNPGNVTGMRVARQLLPNVPHVAVFDTAFFRTLPPAAATYAIDRDVAARHGIHRYGFHGTSHQYVAGEVARTLGRPLDELNQIVLHLGNGASASAIRRGVAVDTSMGMTPLEGLVMGTRPGDLDPGIVLDLLRGGMDADALDELLNHHCGMKGLTGVNDLREIEARMTAGDDDARLALDVYVHRLRRYVGAFTAVLDGVDALTFTAGVGEHSPVVRAAVCGGLEHLGYRIDPALNERRESTARVISPADARIAVLVVPTNEELAIARQAAAAVLR